MIKEHRNVTFVEIQEALGIGASTVNSILHEYLGVRKLASRWIPHSLSDEQKEQRVDWCRFMLKKFDNGRSKSVSYIVTGDETWIYAYDPETKQQSTVWVFEDEPAPTKVTRSRSATKQMVAVFFRKSGPVAAIPLVKQRTVNAEWY
jgi:histone-lysine N-methyltransferase SETMAR